MTTRYRQTWHLNEFTLVHVVRYRDPLNKKRFAVPFKTKEKAQAKMDQLKRSQLQKSIDRAVKLNLPSLLKWFIMQVQA